MYLFKSKINISDLAGLEKSSKKILIYEPKDDLGELYGLYFKENDFEVNHCKDREFLTDILTVFSPHLLVYSLGLLNEFATSIFYLQGLKRSFPSLPMITVSYNLEPEQLKNLMSFGISGHINRHLSRPQDLVTIVRTLI